MGIKKKHKKKHDKHTDKLNDLFDVAEKLVVCDAACQREKKSAELKQKYLDAQINKKMAPAQLAFATKNYVTFDKGEPVFNRMQLAELTEKATRLASVISTNFMELVETTKSDLDDYVNAMRDTQTASNYDKELTDKITTLQNQILQRRNLRVTNNRKSFYENQEIQYIKSWNAFFKFIYYAFVVGLIIALFLVPNTLNIGKKIAIIALTVSYPYYIMYIAKFIMSISASVGRLLPKNVYSKDV